MLNVDNAQELAQKIVRAIIGKMRASITMSDAYKFAMAQAGFPLREETFVLVFRKGGPLFNPFDLEAMVKTFLPESASVKEAAFLTANGYGLTPAMEKALTMSVKVKAAPKGTWIAPGTPVLTVTGPSFLVSWLEPFLIMLNYPLQVATAAKKGVRDFDTTCPDQRQIVYLVGDAVGIPLGCKDDVDYIANVRANVKATVAALGGEAHRGFEVGLRAATCMQQHLMVLEVCREFGLLKTSNVYGAWLLYMIPVGTTGHEHQMRWGGKYVEDINGFRAIRDMRPEPPSYLFDTTNPIYRGIPAALQAMWENPERPCSMRFDSGDQDAQFEAILAGVKKDNLNPNLIFEDGYTAAKTVRNEAFCEQHNWPREKRMYGYGGFFVSQPAKTPYNRDAVSAAYKLSCTAGQAVMKFSGSPGKESIPGKPIVLRVFAPELNESAVIYLIAQEGEIGGDWDCQEPGPLDFIPEKIAVLKSAETINLINQIQENLQKKAA